jgi:hypothetical protein
MQPTTSSANPLAHPKQPSATHQKTTLLPHHTMNKDRQPPQISTPDTWAERVRVSNSITIFTLDPLPRQ